MRPSRKPESSKRIAMSELRYLVKLMQGFYTRGVGDTSPERAARFWQFLRTNCPTFMAALDANFEGEWREIPFTSALNLQWTLAHPLEDEAHPEEDEHG